MRLSTRSASSRRKSLRNKRPSLTLAPRRRITSNVGIFLTIKSDISWLRLSRWNHPTTPLKSLMYLVVYEDYGLCVAEKEGGEVAVWEEEFREEDTHCYAFVWEGQEDSWIVMGFDCSSYQLILLYILISYKEGDRVDRYDCLLILSSNPSSSFCRFLAWKESGP